ncbi:MAG: 16S rRNA (uracil(1498)-N(3))-methyltransferase [Saprospiraceae bacterium]
MQLFYTQHIQGDYAYFPEIEARHAVQVLRKNIGDELQFVDGKGTWYTGVITETGKKKCVLKITNRQENYEPLPSHLHLAIAPTKNIDRLEWCLEKATEIGISEITPLLCHHSERRRIREDRLEKVLVAAMKQSLKAYLPRLNPLTKFNDFMKGVGVRSQEADALPHSKLTRASSPTGVSIKTQNYIAHCADDSKKQLLQHNYTSGADVCILIGPEGDFSAAEIDLAIKHDFRPVSLGQSRLRTETAGVAAVHTISLLNN